MTVAVRRGGHVEADALDDGPEPTEAPSEAADPAKTFVCFRGLHGLGLLGDAFGQLVELRVHVGGEALEDVEGGQVLLHL